MAKKDMYGSFDLQHLQGLSVAGSGDEIKLANESIKNVAGLLVKSPDTRGDSAFWK